MDGKRFEAADVGQVHKPRELEPWHGHSRRLIYMLRGASGVGTALGRSAHVLSL
jgi:hypothetical protein